MTASEDLSTGLTNPGRIRLAHCIHGLGLGGAQQVIKTIVRQCDPRQFEHFVYCAFDGVVREEVEKAGATVRVLPRHLPKFDPVWALRLSRSMIDDRADLVHTHLFGDSLHGFLGARAAGQLPVVMTVHNNYGMFSKLQRVAYRQLLPRCSMAVACSESVRRSWVEAEPNAARNMIAISNGTEPPPPQQLETPKLENLRQELGITQDQVVLAAVGRLVEQKGYSYLLEALSRLATSPDADVRLLLVGDGPLKAKLQQLTNDLHMGEKVIFTGYRPDIRDLLQITDVVVFSSIFEGLPIALLEAMAASRCIVGTSIPGICDAVRDREEALLVPVRDPSSLFEALRRVTTDPDLRSRLGRRARQRWLENFTAERMARQYEEAYRTLWRH